VNSTSALCPNVANNFCCCCCCCCCATEICFLEAPVDLGRPPFCTGSGAVGGAKSLVAQGANSTGPLQSRADPGRTGLLFSAAARPLETPEDLGRSPFCAGRGADAVAKSVVAPKGDLGGDAQGANSTGPLCSSICFTGAGCCWCCLLLPLEAPVDRGRPPSPTGNGAEGGARSLVQPNGERGGEAQGANSTGPLCSSTFRCCLLLLREAPVDRGRPLSSLAGNGAEDGAKSLVQPSGERGGEAHGASSTGPLQPRVQPSADPGRTGRRFSAVRRRFDAPEDLGLLVGT